MKNPTPQTKFHDALMISGHELSADLRFDDMRIRDKNGVTVVIGEYIPAKRSPLKLSCHRAIDSGMLIITLKLYDTGLVVTFIRGPRRSTFVVIGDPEVIVNLINQNGGDCDFSKSVEHWLALFKQIKTGIGPSGTLNGPRHTTTCVGDLPIFLQSPIDTWGMWQVLSETGEDAANMMRSHLGPIALDKLNPLDQAIAKFLFD